MGFYEEFARRFHAEAAKDLERARRALSEEYLLAKSLERSIRRPLDIHVFGMKGLRENLVPGSFLSGLALGYKVLYDEGGVEEMILSFLEKLSKTTYRLHNMYGSWSLGFHASVTLKAKRGGKHRAA